MPFLDHQVKRPVIESMTNLSSPAKKTKYDTNITMGLVENAVLKIEKREKDIVQMMEGVEPKEPSPITSAEVSPTDSGTATPRQQVTIASCPARLSPIIPPKNFGAVVPGTIYRSGFPESRNVEFLESMKLRTILTLVETEAELDVLNFVGRHGIKHVTVPIVANKDGEIRSTPDSLCAAILIAIDSSHHPLHIHCNRGKHRTGCIVACIRKIQRWPIADVLAEYDTYSNPKGRPEDVELIRKFDPESVFDYAKEHGHLEVWPREQGVDAPSNVWELASSLPPHNFFVETPSTISEVSVDDAHLMTPANIDPTLPTYGLDDEAMAVTSNKNTTPSEVPPEIPVEGLNDDNRHIEDDLAPPSAGTELEMTGLEGIEQDDADVNMDLELD